MVIEKQKVIDIIRKIQEYYIDLEKKDKSKKKGVDAILTATTLIICEIEELGKNSFESLLELEGIDKKVDTIKEKQPKQETLEEVVERLYPVSPQKRKIWINGAKWQQEQDKKLYSEEEVYKILGSYSANKEVFSPKYTYNKWFEQFKKK